MIQSSLTSSEGNSVAAAEEAAASRKIAASEDSEGLEAWAAADSCSVEIWVDSMEVAAR